jgi:hypothetical protein
MPQLQRVATNWLDIALASLRYGHSLERGALELSDERRVQAPRCGCVPNFAKNAGLRERRFAYPKSVDFWPLERFGFSRSNPA